MEQYVPLEDGNIYVFNEGSGPPVVFIHGTASYHFCWRNIYPRFSESYNVYIPDLLGAGESDKPINGEYSKEAHANRLIETLMKLKVPPVHLVGHSMGGEICVHIALKAPELVKSLTLVAPDGFRKGINSFLQNLAKRGWLNGMFKQMLKRPPKAKMMSRMLGLPLEKLTPELMEGWTKPYSDPNIPYVITKTLADNDTGVISERVGELNMPVLLIYGTVDKLVPHNVFRSYQEALPEAKVEKFENYGHVLMEECPDKLTNSILKFIDFNNNN
ncbi:hypothetical protein AMS59_04270 [Lysinibacillus sp. FJAT-14745]|uniref:alpha/beta fold hydrolase n=1 Tax=Lysinibacillus sp. FJAT-14745 TaxID=1704289 RepID=UPI0006ABC143|nr:alpha/beta hydrolase [Lysinibacillus sp. FJAT-14745]KOP80598.1 hypothetical protein AMS59_04270 [Lysinibacillus sp. FJAT-14745]